MLIMLTGTQVPDSIQPLPVLQAQHLMQPLSGMLPQREGRTTWEAKPQKESLCGASDERRTAEIPAITRPRGSGRQPGSNKAQKKAQSDLKANLNKIDRVTRGRGALFFFGWVLLAIGALSAFEPLFAGEFWTALKFAAVAAGGGAMLIAGASKTKKEKEYEKYLKIVGNKACIRLKSWPPLWAARSRKYTEIEDCGARLLRNFRLRDRSEGCL
jgi:hypothetical protein